MSTVLPLKINGKVVKGSGDGRKIGVPTANIKPDIPLNTLKEGVYSSKILINNKKHFAVTHYGPRAVFGEVHPLLEVHILDFDQDIYGERVEVELLRFQRATMKFESVEEMLKQIEEDVRETVSILK